MSARGPDVLGHAEVVQVLGVTREGLDYLRRKHATFPPATQLACGPVWSTRAILDWKAENR